MESAAMLGETGAGETVAADIVKGLTTGLCEFRRGGGLRCAYWSHRHAYISAKKLKSLDTFSHLL